MWFDEKSGLAFPIVKVSLTGLSNLVVDICNICLSGKKMKRFVHLQILTTCLLRFNNKCKLKFIIYRTTIPVVTLLQPEEKSHLSLLQSQMCWQLSP